MVMHTEGSEGKHPWAVVELQKLPGPTVENHLMLR